jgi:hypothetical protein
MNELNAGVYKDFFQKMLYQHQQLVHLEIEMGNRA